MPTNGVSVALSSSQVLLHLRERRRFVVPLRGDRARVLSRLRFLGPSPALVVGLVPEVTVIILPEGDSVSVAARSVVAIEKRVQQSKSLVIGPGLGDDEATSTLLGMLFGFRRMRGEIGFGSAGAKSENDSEGVIPRAGKPVVVDADALNWLAGQQAWWERVPAGQLVLTPHAGEMARLTD